MNDGRFTGSGAEGYDARIVRRVPGYELLHHLTAAELSVRLPAAARILVVGAGTGRELVELAAAAPGWRFLAIDPEPEMLALARRRCEAAGIADRVEWAVATVDTLAVDTPAFDAAVMLLVMHFIAGEAAKCAQLDALRRQLRPGGWLALAELLTASDEWERPALNAATLAGGLQPSELEAMRAALGRDFHTLTPARRAELLLATGFAQHREYFRVPGFSALIARRA